MSEIEPFIDWVMSGCAVGVAGVVWWCCSILEREAIEEELFRTGLSVILERGFQPDTIVVKAGQRVRLNFTRRETSDCGDLIIPAFGQRVNLPINRTITVEITPEKPGEYDFTCESNSSTGRLIVEPS